MLQEAALKTVQNSKWPPAKRKQRERNKSSSPNERAAPKSLLFWVLSL